MGMLDRVGTGEYEIPDRIDPRRTELRDEFMAGPYALHSAELQLPLAAMRSNRDLPRWVLLTREPGRSYQAEAERYVFDLRWKALSGEVAAGA